MSILNSDRRAAAEEKRIQELRKKDRVEDYLDWLTSDIREDEALKARLGEMSIRDFQNYKLRVRQAMARILP